MKIIQVIAFSVMVVLFRYETFGQSETAATNHPVPADNRSTQGMHGQHPVINDILSAINKDTLAANIQSMVVMGTRFMYAENRRAVASMIAGKFRSYGITDVKLDSFRMVGETLPEDSVWQYNVVATLNGSSAPGEIYIISAHHDDYVNPDPHMPAPGADDNASGCAVAMEIARVMREKGFQPSSTIRFVTYAAEELVGYKNYSGSIYYADKIHTNMEDLRLDLCNDMVAYPANADYSIFGNKPAGKNSKWAGDLMEASSNLYTSLNIIPGPYAISDAFHFWELGYSVTGFEEYGLNPNYHSINDSLSNCDMDFCLEVARANCAILLNEQLTPVPQSVSCATNESSVSIFWKPTTNANVKGFLVHRSTSPDSGFAVIGQTAPGDSSFRDTTATSGILYYYYVSTFDNLSYESICTNVVHAALTPKDRETLVVKDSDEGYNNPPDSAVTAFYRQICRDLKYDYSDASEIDSLTIAVLGRYRRVLWFSNNFSASQHSSFRSNQEDITAYLQSGGQLFLAGFMPTYLIAGNQAMNRSFQPADTIWRWYKISEVRRKPAALLNGGLPCEKDYDTLWVDPLKCPPEFVGHVNNVECVFPAPDATLIYKFNSAYDTTSTFGQMKGKPVGIEYLGTDFKVIILSIPVYYLDSLDAKNLVGLVVNEKFRSHTGIENDLLYRNCGLLIRTFPNPAKNKTTLSFYLPGRSRVNISVHNILGKSILSQPETWMEEGFHTLSIDLGRFPAGVYTGRLSTGYSSGSVLIIKE